MLRSRAGTKPEPHSGTHKLDGASGGAHDTRVFLRADRTIDYGELMSVMSALRSAGYLKVALVGLEGSDLK